MVLDLISKKERTMDMTKFTNTKTVDEFVTDIQKYIQASSKNWWQIALAFAEAKDMYGTGSQRFKELSERTSFSDSKVAKLVSIVSSDRLKQYARKLSSVHSWGTLYAITTLTEEQFAAFKEKYELDKPDLVVRFISQEDVDGFRREAKERSVFKNYAIIQVDDEAVKGALLTGVEFDELQNVLTKLETLSSYIAVKRVSNDEKEELSRLNRVEDRVQQLIRKQYLDATNLKLTDYKRHKGESQSVFESRILGKNMEELMLDLKINDREAFKYLGIEYDMAAFYKKAEAEVNASEVARIDRYAKKVLSRPPVVKEPEYDDAEIWDQLKKESAERKEKERTRVARMISASKNVA